MIRGKRLMIDDYLYEWKSPEYWTKSGRKGCRNHSSPFSPQESRPGAGAPIPPIHNEKGGAIKDAAGHPRPLHSIQSIQSRH